MVVSFHTTDLDGETRINPDARTRRSVLASLNDSEDADFPDVSLVHGSGWGITISAEWVAVLERIPDDGSPGLVLRLTGLEQAMQLWEQLAAGQLDAVQALPWRKPEEV